MARREHSRKELRQKLQAGGATVETVETVIDQLGREGLQSDIRFTVSYLSSRLQKGYGPVRLKQELHERGIDHALIDSALEAIDVDWMDVLQKVRDKKFGKGHPLSYSEQAKESRFLQYRGYTSEQIRRLYKNED